MIKYEPAPDVFFDLEAIVKKLAMGHVNLNNVVCMRSYGSKSRRTLGRCWGLPKIWQLALGSGPAYVVEVISERYDHLSPAEKERVLIHELWHIPKSFMGGLKNHDREFGKTINNPFMDRLHNLFKLRSGK